MFVLAQVLAGDPAALGAAAAIRIRATELAWLVGVFRACHRSMGVCIERVPMVVLGVRRATEVATVVIGPADFAVAEQRGGQFRPGGDAAREYLRRRWPVRPVAVDTPVDHGESADSRWASLSAAEREVAVPAAAGWPNSAIAERQGSSVRTVDTQVAGIRRKLVIGSPRQIPDHIPAHLAGAVDAEPAAARTRNRRCTPRLPGRP